MFNEEDEFLYDSQFHNESYYSDVEYLDDDLGDNCMDQSEISIQSPTIQHTTTTAKKRLFEVSQTDQSKTKKKAVGRVVVPKDATRFEKRTLAGLVEKESLIWDLNHELHSNIQAVTAAWERIQKKLPHRTVLECKGIWKSLRDSSRYRGKRKGKTGDSADEEEEQTETDWEFSDCMSFLKPMSSKYPRTTQTMGLEVPPTPTSTELNESTSCQSNYSYASGRKNKDPIIESVTSISQSITDLIASRNDAKSNQVQQVDQRKLKFDYIWFNLDHLFQQMTQEDVNYLNLEFMKLAFDVINKNQTEV